MSAISHAHRWIERAWIEIGRDFKADNVPVSLFRNLKVDDMSFPFKNEAIESWLLINGTLHSEPGIKINRVPFIAFSVSEANSTMNIQVNWASRCGYGFEISFDESGEVTAQKMRWIS